MGWSFDRSRNEGKGAWVCTQYSDLNYAEINNLAEYGQPWSPYERGFVQDFEPDFSNITIEMPHAEVMVNGYGRAVKAEDFPIVKRFLKKPLQIPYGTYTFADLVRLNVAKDADRRITSSLYRGNWGRYGVSAGNINSGDAAYIHGTVGFALMERTRFIYSKDTRRVEAEIGAGDDNWDFNSSTIWRPLNAAVATLFGPDHYNLTDPIKIQFRGPGKRSVAERKSSD